MSRGPHSNVGVDARDVSVSLPSSLPTQSDRDDVEFFDLNTPRSQSFAEAAENDQPRWVYTSNPVKRELDNSLIHNGSSTRNDRSYLPDSISKKKTGTEKNRSKKSSIHKVKRLEKMAAKRQINRSDDSLSDIEQTYGALKVRAFTASFDIDANNHDVLNADDHLYLKLMFAALPEGSLSVYPEIAQRNGHLESHSSRIVSLTSKIDATGRIQTTAPFYCEQILEISRRQIDPWKEITAKMREDNEELLYGGLKMGLLLLICKNSKGEGPDVATVAPLPNLDHRSSVLQPCYQNDNSDGVSSDVISVAFIPLAEIFEGDNIFTSDSENGPLLLYERLNPRRVSESPRRSIKRLGTMDVSLWWSPGSLHDGSTIDKRSTENSSRISTVEACDSGAQRHVGSIDQLTASRSMSMELEHNSMLDWEGSLASMISDPATCNILLSLLQHKTYRKSLVRLLRSKAIQFEEMNHASHPLSPVDNADTIDAIFDMATGQLTLNQLQLEREPLELVLKRIRENKSIAMDQGPLRVSILIDVVELPDSVVGLPEDILADPYAGPARTHRLFKNEDEDGWAPSFQGGVLRIGKANIELNNDTNPIVYPWWSPSSRAQSTPQTVEFCCEPKTIPENKSYFCVWVTVDAYDNSANLQSRASMMTRQDRSNRRVRKNVPIVLGYNVIEIENPNCIPWNVMVQSGQIAVPLYSEMSVNHQQRTRELTVGAIDFHMEVNRL